jgi:guanylate kinase
MSSPSSSEGFLIVVSGPSAVGKDTILDRLLEIPDRLKRPLLRCVTATTRPPRPDEREGVSYHFLSAAQFNAIAQQDGFLEYANVSGNWYGTPKSWVNDRRAAGDDIVLKIDVQGAFKIRELVPDAILIFLRPPSLEELERRLRARNTETEEQIARRLLDARSELTQAIRYDYVIVNDTIDEAVIDLAAVLRSEHCRNRTQIKQDNKRGS